MLLRWPVLLSSALLLVLVISRDFLSCAPLVAKRRRGRSVAFVHAFILVGPLFSFPQINILAAALLWAGRNPFVWLNG